MGSDPILMQINTGEKWGLTPFFVLRLEKGKIIQFSLALGRYSGYNMVYVWLVSGQRHCVKEGFILVREAGLA